MDHPSVFFLNKMSTNVSKITQLAQAKQQTVVLNYSTGFSLTSTLSVPDRHMFRPMSLHDIDYSGVGHQPMGFDQLMEFYEKYTVIKATYRLKALGMSGSPLQASIVGASILNQPGVSNLQASEPMEQQGSINTSVTTYGGAKLLATSREPSTPLSTLAGAARHSLPPDFSGTATSSPQEDAYVAFWCTPIDRASSIVNVACWIDWEITAVLTQPKTLIQS